MAPHPERFSGGIFLRAPASTIEKNVFHPFRNTLARGPDQMLTERIAHRGFFRVDFDRTRESGNFMHESRGRINLSGCSDGRENFATPERFENSLHFQGNFTKPDDVRPKRPREPTARATSVRKNRVFPIENISAFQATRFQKLAMHMDEILRSCALMKIIHILCNDEHLTQPLRFPLALQEGQRAVGIIGLDLGRLKLGTPGIVEILNQFWVSQEPLRGGHVLDPMVFPEPAVVAEGLNP